MSERALKTGWHLLLVAAAAVEFKTSKTSFRRLLTGACAGWHLAAAYDDWFGEEEKPAVNLALESFDVGYALGRYEAENPQVPAEQPKQPEEAMGVLVRDKVLMQQIFDSASEGEA